MKCPVCEKKGLNADAETCPQCDSDLKGFQLITALSDYDSQLKTTIQDKEAKVNSEKKRSKYAILLAISSVLVAITFIWSFSNNKVDQGDFQAQLQAKSDSLLVLKDTNPKIISTAQSVGSNSYEHEYVIRKGDNLTKIARFFYNDPSYAQIMKVNGIKDANQIKIGDTLTLKLQNNGKSLE